MGALGGSKTSLLSPPLKDKAPLVHLPSQAQLAQRRAGQVVAEVEVEAEVANLPWKWLR